MNKKHDFPKKQVILSETFRTVAHPARLEIIRVLASANSPVNGELTDVGSLAPSTVNLHLLDMKKAGIVGGQIMGKKSAYHLNWDYLEEMEKAIELFFKELNAMRKESGAKTKSLGRGSKSKIA
ncbi:MAG: transcriptional regulator [Bacteroidetes bacterium]|nr:MAG: transcriptional regulator [Bacteroidota bacterium]